MATSALSKSESQEQSEQQQQTKRRRATTAITTTAKTTDTKGRKETTNMAGKTGRVEKPYSNTQAKARAVDEKRLKRLLRNRVSAQQARERKKHYIVALESRASDLDTENADLKDRITALEKENEVLRRTMIQQSMASRRQAYNTGFAAAAAARLQLTANVRRLPARREASRRTHVAYRHRERYRSAPSAAAAASSEDGADHNLRALLVCPACGLKISLKKFANHTRLCCQDLFEGYDVSSLSHGSSEWREMMQIATQRERELRIKALELMYGRTGLESAYQIRELMKDPNNLKKRGLQDVELLAESLNLDLKRTKRMLQLARKMIPLPADLEDLDIVYEDDDILCVNKPPNLRSQPRHRFEGGSVVNRAIRHLQKSPHVVHRLDMDTSGVMVLAKSPRAAAHLSDQFQRRLPRKVYLCVCYGVPRTSNFAVDASIGNHPTIQEARQAYAGANLNDSSLDTKSASTDFRCLSKSEQGDGFCLLEAVPKTGRTHQIRVHAAFAGHILLGDVLYGAPQDYIGRHALHAFGLELIHPTTNKVMQFRAELPEDLKQAIRQTNLELKEEWM